MCSYRNHNLSCAKSYTITAALSASPTILRHMMTDGIMLHYVTFSVSGFCQLVNFSVITASQCVISGRIVLYFVMFVTSDCVYFNCQPHY